MIFENFCDGPANNGPTTFNSTGPDQFSYVDEDVPGHLTYDALQKVQGSTSIRSHVDTAWGSSYVQFSTESGLPSSGLDAASLYVRFANEPPSPTKAVFVTLGDLEVSFDSSVTLRLNHGGNRSVFYPGTVGPLNLDTWYYVVVEADATSCRLKVYSVPDIQELGQITVLVSSDPSRLTDIGGFMYAGITNLQSGDATVNFDHLQLGDETIPLPDGTLDLRIRPATVWVDAPAPYQGLPFPAPTVEADAPTPIILTAMPTLISPAVDGIIPSLKPAFQVAVPADKMVNGVEVEVSETADFADPVGSKAVDASPNIASVVPLLFDTQLLPNQVYYWRARLINDWTEGLWSAERAFSISSLDGDGIIGGTWFVATDTVPAPHLWYVTPDRGKAGDSAVAVGTGFGPNLVQVTIGGIQASVTDVSIVDDNADALTDERVIDADSDSASPRRQRVTFTVPDVPQPGGALYVEGM